MHRTGLSGLRSHLSNERRHLSYTHTCISMLGLGITINRFSVFMQEKEKLVADGSGPLLRSSEYARAGGDSAHRGAAGRGRGHGGVAVPAALTAATRAGPMGAARAVIG
jgi:hypothetical protein